jgi:LemA protein
LKAHKKHGAEKGQRRDALPSAKSANGAHSGLHVKVLQQRPKISRVSVRRTFMKLMSKRILPPVATWTMILILPGCGYNDLQGLDEDTNAAWSEVINQYQRRADLIPNLVATVKGYAAHEKNTLEGVVAARAKAARLEVTPETLRDPASFKQYQEAQQELSSSLGRLLAIAEQYPDLKADQNFRDLQSQIEGTENRIAVARKRYLDKIADYNKMVRYFPTNLTAKFLLHLEEKQNFTVANEKALPKPPEVAF